MRPILLATDGSPSAEAATAEAIELAKRLDAPLVAACVEHDPTPVYGSYYGYAEIVTELRETQRTRIAEILADVEQRAKDAGVECETVTLQGIVGEALCEEAKTRRARLLVVGAHGWGRVGRLIHGSVSTYVLHHATSPVLVVHGDEVRAAA